MASNIPRGLQEIAFEREAQAYLRSLPPEHFMEAISQATQRMITVVCFELVRLRRPDIHIFSELLLQYARRGQRKPGQVVPDNMVVLTTERIRATTCYNVPLEPVGPFWVFEYVSKSNERKDYEDNFLKYERELKVPYYLVFYPDTQDLTLYRHNKRKYVTVKENEKSRYPIPELEMEMGLLDGWVRYWYKGELMPLPAELERDRDETKRQLEAEKRRADEEKRRADELQRRLEAMERERGQERP